jgi:hypothetical protein
MWCHVLDGTVMSIVLACHGGTAMAISILTNFLSGDNPSFQSFYRSTGRMWADTRRLQQGGER